MIQMLTELKKIDDINLPYRRQLFAVFLLGAYRLEASDASLPSFLELAQIFYIPANQIICLWTCVMPTISSIRNDASIKQDNSQGVTAKTANHSTDKNGTAEASRDNHRSVELSTRAQKIQKLNEEFFSAGPLSVSITPEFIARLTEYGFLSTDQASNLSPSVASPDENLSNTLGELSLFIDQPRESIL
ncbi:MAG: hypothetical protein V7752_20945 [Halopseudomonas sp.]